ncbi:uncharacterized protein LOC143565247 [Bidens hawaiensis]|uniref:uncharacterized protein LOC143565247 n=1 Tax=Bidens hawaiensis TaxID=980011 RepID=UPI004049C5DD
MCDCDKRGDRARVRYARDEIEGLRFGNLDQQKKWVEVYCGLGFDVAKEYDGLVGCKHDEDGNYVSFDPRPQFAGEKKSLFVAVDMLTLLMIRLDSVVLVVDKKSVFVGNGSENVSCEMQNMNQVESLSGIDANDFDEEEDYYEDEDSDSEYASIQRPALYVTGEPDFDSGPPQDGLEYLRRVRWEAKRIPKVKIAKVDKTVLNKEQTVYMPNIPDIAACPKHLMPSKEWEDVFLADFSNLRLALSEAESSDFSLADQTEPTPHAQTIIDNAIQENLDFTNDDTLMVQENLDVNQTEDKTAINDLPSFRNIMEMEPRARVTMLRKRIVSVEQMSYLRRLDCAWLFALCAAIDTPLDADTSASLRCLLRKCAALRAAKTSLDDEVIMLNILATVSGRYFGQLENS